MLSLSCSTALARLLPNFRPVVRCMKKWQKEVACKSKVSKCACGGGVVLENPEFVCEKNPDEAARKRGFKSMWENPECCLDFVDDTPVRTDTLYYKVTDKTLNKFDRTWSECADDLQIEPRPKCKFERICMPPMEKRVNFKCATAKCCGRRDSEVLRCNGRDYGGCPRFTLVGCKKVRRPPKCKEMVVPKNCRKICTPYPAYSECKNDGSNYARPIECQCLEDIPMCIVRQMQAKIEEEELAKNAKKCKPNICKQKENEAKRNK